MLRINKSDRDHFHKHGWVQVSMNLEKNFIEECYESLKSLEQKAKDINYPLGRTYHPHLFNSNQAGIEAPFNKLLMDDNLLELFKKIKLGGFVRDLKKWESTSCELARLFTMGNFNYRGHWHRDIESYDGDIMGANEVKVVLYLKDQKGFRIWKPQYDYWGSHPVIKSDKLTPFDNSSGLLPLKTSQKFYDVIEGKAGNALFFCPGVMHQGSVASKRLDLHMKFINPLEDEEKKSKMNNYLVNTFQDFYIPNDYSYDFNPLEDSISNLLATPTFKSKLKNSLNYYTGVLNFYNLSKSKFFLREKIPPPWHEEIFSNTIFQSK